MERHRMKELMKWQATTRRKPIVINGARQVGKTWLLKEFGRRCFDNVAYVNFDNNEAMVALFEGGYDIQRLMLGIQAETGERVVPSRTLLIFDEVQECPKALTSLKYFRENLPELHVAAAGSLLGLTLHSGTGFPVGNVTMLNLYPLTFEEFLDARHEENLRELLVTGDGAVASAFSARAIPLLRDYYYVGGMPSAVLAFMEEGYSAARREQEQILLAYRLDMSKHIDAREVERILAVWDSIPRHLGKENKKFIFGQIREGARARDYRSAITWLSQAGLVTVVQRASKPGMPLSAYVDDAAFKLFVLDTGLLGAMSGLGQKAVVEGSRIFTEFKGSLTEQYVCQQLVAAVGDRPYYWTSANGASEVDFLVQDERGTFPIEVKAEENLRSKSLRAFSERYEGMESLRLSLSGFRVETWLRNIPLYAMANRGLWTTPHAGEG